MNLKKVGLHFIALLLTLTMVLAMMPQEVYAGYQTQEEQQAYALSTLGLFQGNSYGYQLHRQPTRMECIAMIIRLMGEEQAAKLDGSSHPFTDVPKWASPYASYAYNKGLSQGISQTEFGTNRGCTEEEFLTFLLRSLGYLGQAEWLDKQSVLQMSETVGLLNETMDKNLFTRGFMVQLTYGSLNVKLKGEDRTLGDSLIEKGTITQAGLDAARQAVAAEPKEVKTVCLTFDDGPNTKVTPKVLDILKENGIAATFFVVGNQVDKNPAMLQREYEEGHRIGNHSFSHQYDYIYKNTANLMEEIKKTDAIIDKAMGFDYKSDAFRFPGGSFEKKQVFKDAVLNAGYHYYDWNCSGSDATSIKGSTAKEILEATKASSKNKEDVIVLLHDAATKGTTAEALPQIINYFRQQGYVFRTL